jgi:hypothetical protein
VYEIFPIGAGVILGLAVAGRGRLRLASALGLDGLGLAVMIGVTVSFVSGEWRDGVVYPIWDAFQAAAAYTLSLAIAWRWIGRRAPREEG